MASELPVVDQSKLTHHDDDNALHVCKTCANEFQGKFCNRCGERIMNPHDRSIFHFLESVFHTITHFDGKIFKNLKLILLKPGFISKKLSEGSRQPFMNPLSMFFVGNLIYFLFPIFQTFNTSFSSQLNSQPWKKSAKEIVIKKMRTENIGEEELALKYNAKSTTLSKLMLVIFIPLGAVVFSILNFKRSRYFADHLLMSMEFMCFVIFYCTLFIAYLLFGVYGIFKLLSLNLDPFNESFLLPVIMLSMFYFLYRSQRSFYGQKIIWAVVKSILVISAFGYLLDAYRFILFHVTINSI